MPTPAKDGFNVKVAVSAAVLRHFVAKRLVLALIFPDAATQIAMFRSLRFANGTVYLHFLAFAHDRIPQEPTSPNIFRAICPALRLKPALRIMTMSRWSWMPEVMLQVASASFKKKSAT